MNNKNKFDYWILSLLITVIGGVLVVYITTGIKPHLFEKIFNSHNTDAYLNTYILNIKAVVNKKDAMYEVQILKRKGYNAGYLWIPNYESLSGAKFYTVFIGPFNSQLDCEVATEKYKKIDPNVYGTWVSKENKRIEIRGIGKVKVIDNYKKD